EGEGTKTVATRPQETLVVEAGIMAPEAPVRSEFKPVEAGAGAPAATEAATTGGSGTSGGFAVASAATVAAAPAPASASLAEEAPRPVKKPSNLISSMHSFTSLVAKDVNSGRAGTGTGPAHHPGMWGKSRVGASGAAGGASSVVGASTRHHKAGAVAGPVGHSKTCPMKVGGGRP
ncbi:unnamed protein product, partial [Discosporangium mesarthrocarpum]